MSKLNKPTYHDVVWTVFALSGLDRWEDDDRKWQPFFYEWKDRDTTGLLKDISFDTRMPWPLSDELGRVVETMFMCKMIYTIVPQTTDTQGFYWHKDVRKGLLERANSLFPQEELQFLQDMAKDFCNRFSLGRRSKEATHEG